jgi:hypothetical protein
MVNIFKKLLVTLIAIFTFGTITPDLGQPLQKSDNSSNPKEIGMNDSETQADEDEGETWGDLTDSVSKATLRNELIRKTYETANEQAAIKFGPIIKKRIGKDFEDSILPSIVATVEEFTLDLDINTLQNVTFTSNPSGGLSEKIFHMYDKRTGNDLLRFHVRRENPPLQGHFFSFHFHSVNDSYEHHYEIGKLFWDKNTPPKWKKVA